MSDFDKAISETYTAENRLELLSQTELPNGSRFIISRDTGENYGRINFKCDVVTMIDGKPIIDRSADFANIRIEAEVKRERTDPTQYTVSNSSGKIKTAQDLTALQAMLYAAFAVAKNFSE